MTPDVVENAYDSILVANIDIGCSDESVDIVKVSMRNVDPEGNASTSVFDKEESWNHEHYFQVKFDGKPYQIEPGKTKYLPRFVAEHFAKHLADHLLQKMEQNTGRNGLVQSSVERPRILKQILNEVNADIVHTTINTPVAQSDTIDKDPVVDAGVVPNAAIGTLKAEPPTLEEVLIVAGEDPKHIDKIPTNETSIVDDKKPQPTRKQLIEMCYSQSIDIVGTENKAQLIEKLKRG